MASVPSLSDQIGTERRRVDFDSYDITVQQLTSMVAERQIDVAPAYQRQFRWDEARQSELIESVFLGIPVPNLFMAANADGTWEVVDGVQRLSTLVHFAGSSVARNALRLDGALTVAGLEKLSELNGLSFDRLPPSLALQFSLRPIKVTTLSDKSDSKVRFDLFERLNRGGVQLTDQEIRGCIYRGGFNDFLEKLATYPAFRQVVHLRRAAEGDGSREEYVLRFFAFLNSYSAFEHSVVDFLNDYMESASHLFDYEQGELIFRRTFKELSLIFPDGIRKRQRLTPVNLFEGVAVGAAITLAKRHKLASKNLDWVASDEFKALTTGATNTPKMVTGRIEFAAKAFGW